ncbi:MAG: beta-lactamase domain protein [Parcubacteria group bacterium Gr01-1014_18]|nr:MAG: beta-lactamase domain protein [Parcubacteria group bacterium Greene0416_36]TSC81301.1 MAG: beta-lactamase domain protein [Parcubacteria group bacterium Gr01-1014_18]TSC99323.1 MAG: beta-lactamase domain protein [Parcubacteria group bacterium Greene1014_20]TSD06840.1 MAG: beta-lactamase domain protein [Parcubacteria group bacterium Greene0714_2]
MKRLYLLLALVIVGVGVFWFWICQTDFIMEVSILDVGQGDSILVRSPEKIMLIDGGPNARAVSELGRVLPAGTKKLDWVVITHPHLDHFGGLFWVADRYEIGELWVFTVSGSPQYERFLSLAREKKIPVRMPAAPEQIDLGGGVRVEVLYPFQAGNPFTNNDSVVLKASYGEIEFLLTGDIEAPRELELVNKKVDLEAEFLKLAHHGSKTSSVIPFLEAVDPLYTFISAGENNRFDHPSRKTLYFLGKLGIPFYRTDIDGRTTVRLEF